MDADDDGGSATSAVTTIKDCTRCYMPFKFKPNTPDEKFCTLQCSKMSKAEKKQPVGSKNYSTPNTKTSATQRIQTERRRCPRTLHQQLNVLAVPKSTCQTTLVKSTATLPAIRKTGLKRTMRVSSLQLEQK